MVWGVAHFSIIRFADYKVCTAPIYNINVDAKPAESPLILKIQGLNNSCSENL